MTTVVRVVRYAALSTAAVLALLAVLFTRAAFGIPLEAGGVLFAPMLLTMAGFAATGAIGLVVRWWR